LLFFVQEVNKLSLLSVTMFSWKSKAMDSWIFTALQEMLTRS